MNASLITLLAYIFVLVPLMLLGFYFARRKMFDPHHKLVMTGVVILNWIFIGVVMVRSYAGGVTPNLPDDIGQIRHLLPTIHLVTGSIAQILATYLIILMWTENTPFAWLAIVQTRNIKPIMRTTLALWLITVLLGFGIYAVWNAPAGEVEADAPIAVTEEVTEAPDVEATEEVDDDDDDGEPELDATEEVDDDDDDEPELDATEEVDDDNSGSGSSNDSD